MARLRTIDGVRKVSLKSSEKPDAKGDEPCPANRSSDPRFSIAIAFAVPGAPKATVDATGQVAAAAAAAVRPARPPSPGHRVGAAHRHEHREGRLMDARLRSVLAIAVTLGVDRRAMDARRRARSARTPRSLGDQVALAEQRLADANARAATAEQARATYARDYATVARLGKAVPVSDRRALARLPARERGSQGEGRLPRGERARRRRRTRPRRRAPPPAAGRRHPAGAVLLQVRGRLLRPAEAAGADRRFSRVKGTQVAVNGRLLTIDGLTLNPASRGLAARAGRRDRARLRRRPARRRCPRRRGHRPASPDRDPEREVTP